MRIVVDTSVLIDHLRGVPEAKSIMVNAAKRGDPLCASVLTRVEVLAGMRANEEVATRRLFAALEWVVVDESLAELAGEEEAGLRAVRLWLSYPFPTFPRPSSLFSSCETPARH